MGHKQTFETRWLCQATESKADGVTPVDHDLLSGDVGGSFRRKKNGNTGEVPRFAPAPQWHSVVEPRDVLIILQKGRGEICFEIARQNAVACDAIFTKFRSKGARQADESALRRRISMNFPQSENARNRGCKNNSAMFFLTHRYGRVLRKKEASLEVRGKKSIPIGWRPVQKKAAPLRRGFEAEELRPHAGKS